MRFGHSSRKGGDRQHELHLDLDDTDVRQKYFFIRLVVFFEWADQRVAGRLLWKYGSASCLTFIDTRIYLSLFLEPIWCFQSNLFNACNL